MKDCKACDGLGRTIEASTLFGPVIITCVACNGTGKTGEPPVEGSDVLPIPPEALEFFAGRDEILPEGARTIR